MTLDFIAIRDNQIRIRELKNFIRPYVAEIRSRQLTISRLRAYHIFETAITTRDNKIKSHSATNFSALPSVFLLKSARCFKIFADISAFFWISSKVELLVFPEV